MSTDLKIYQKVTTAVVNVEAKNSQWKIWSKALHKKISDDCYTELRVMVANYVNCNLQSLEISGGYDL